MQTNKDTNMGLFNFIKKDKSGKVEEDEETHVCALCGQEIKPGEGRYYAGQWWHKKCLRKNKKIKKSFI